MSTPGFKGQSGGPLFDERGIIYGMQSAITSLNLGQCIHAQVIKDFLRKEKVKFYEDDQASVGAVSTDGALVDPLCSSFDIFSPGGGKSN